MKEYCSIPSLHIERGEGCWLWDTVGNRYLDGNASIWTNALGHNDPDLNRVLIDQVGKVSHTTYLGLSHPAGAELGRRLVELSPGNLTRALFSDNGSNAIEIALKLSFQYWQLVEKPEKRLVVGMEGGYHGDTFGAMSAGNSESFHGRFRAWQFESRSFPRPNCAEINGRITAQEVDRSLEALESILSQESKRAAAVVIEPSIQGPAGMMLQPPGFLEELARLCRRFDVHLILDEVFVGCGRTGDLFVCQAESIEPDFLCLAKGLSAGYLPIAATLTSETIYEAFLGDFDSGKGFYHGHTFTGNPLAARVALESLEKIQGLIESGRLKRTIHYFGNAFERAISGLKNVSGARQRGLSAVIDLIPGNGVKPWKVNDRVGLEVCLAARERGLLLRPLMDSILVVPPLVIENEEIDFLFANLKEAINTVMKKKSI